MSEFVQSSLSNILFRVRKNVMILLGGNAIASLLGFAALAFNARALGPESLGILALLQVFVVTVSKLFSFETWQPVLKFGAEALTKNDNARLRDVVAIGFLYDLAGAVTATLVGFAIVAIGLPFLGIESQYQEFASVFAATLILGVTGSVTGMLRLLGRFGSITVIQLGVSAGSLLAAATLWLANAPLSAYVVTHAGLIAAHSCAVLFAGVFFWRKYQLPSPFTPCFADRNLIRGFLQFSWSTSAMSSINVMRQNAETLAIAVLLGPSATGLYKVASQIASLITRFGDPLQQALFPEIASLVASGEIKKLSRILLRAFFAGVALLLVFVGGVAAFAEAAVLIVGGANFAAAGPLLFWLSLAYGLSVCGFYIRPTVVTLIGPVYHLLTYIAALAVFIPVIYFSITTFGISGAGMSALAFTVVWYSLNTGAIVSRLKITSNDVRRGFFEAFRVFLRSVKSHFTQVIGRRRLLSNVKLIAEIAKPDRHIWAGYYDLQVISPDAKRIVYHSWAPGAASVEFGIYDLNLGVFQMIGETDSWSFQFGTRLQFITNDLLLHYEKKDGLVDTCFRRVSDGRVMRRLEGVAYYSISATHQFISALNYSHIKRHRAGYGFDCLSHDVESALTLLDLSASEKKVIWRLELRECAELARGAAGDKTITKDTTHLNVALFSPDSRKIAFTVASFTDRRRQHLFVADLDGRNMIVCPLANASHYCWVDSDEISVFGKSENGVSGYWYWTISSDELRSKGKVWPGVDGHQTRHPVDSDLWVADSYPDRFGYQYLYLMDTKKRCKIGAFYAPFGMAFDKCDLHPRWSNKGDSIIVDTAYSGLRRMLVLEVPK